MDLRGQLETNRHELLMGVWADGYPTLLPGGTRMMVRCRAGVVNFLFDDTASG